MTDHLSFGCGLKPCVFDSIPLCGCGVFAPGVVLVPGMFGSGKACNKFTDPALGRGVGKVLHADDLKCDVRDSQLVKTRPQVLQLTEGPKHIACCCDVGNRTAKSRSPPL